MANICFTASEDHENEVNYITSNDDDLQSLFEEMILNMKFFIWKMPFLRKKIKSWKGSQWAKRKFWKSREDKSHFSKGK